MSQQSQMVERTCAGQPGGGGNLHISAALSAARLAMPLGVDDVVNGDGSANNLL